MYSTGIIDIIKLLFCICFHFFLKCLVDQFIVLICAPSGLSTPSVITGRPVLLSTLTLMVWPLIWVVPSFCFPSTGRCLTSPTIPHDWPVIRVVPSFCPPSTGRCLTSPPSFMVGLSFGWSLPFAFLQQADALPPHHPY